MLYKQFMLVLHVTKINLIMFSTNVNPSFITVKNTKFKIFL